MQLNPSNRFLYVELVEDASQEEPEAPSAVLLPEEYLRHTKQRYGRARLLGVGSQCVSFSQADVGNIQVIVDTTMLESFEDHAGKTHHFISEGHIMAYYAFGGE